MVLSYEIYEKEHRVRFCLSYDIYLLVFCWEPVQFCTGSDWFSFCIKLLNMQEPAVCVDGYVVNRRSYMSGPFIWNIWKGTSGKILLIIWHVLIGILLHYETVEFQQNPEKLSLDIMMLMSILRNQVLLAKLMRFEPVHEISNNVVCATSKASDQPAYTRSLIRAFASHLSILWLLSYWLNTILSFLA